MSGQTMNYKNSLNTSGEPIMPSELPDVIIDYNGLRQYAKEKGIPVINLSEEEKNLFVKKVEKGTIVKSVKR